MELVSAPSPAPTSEISAVEALLNLNSCVGTNSSCAAPKKSSSGRKRKGSPRKDEEQSASGTGAPTSPTNLCIEPEGAVSAPASTVGTVSPSASSPSPAAMSPLAVDQSAFQTFQGWGQSKQVGRPKGSKSALPKGCSVLWAKPVTLKRAVDPLGGHVALPPATPAASPLVRSAPFSATPPSPQPNQAQQLLASGGANGDTNGDNKRQRTLTLHNGPGFAAAGGIGAVLKWDQATMHASPGASPSAVLMPFPPAPAAGDAAITARAASAAVAAPPIKQPPGPTPTVALVSVPVPGPHMTNVMMIAAPTGSSGTVHHPPQPVACRGAGVAGGGRRAGKAEPGAAHRAPGGARWNTLVSQDGKITDMRRRPGMQPQTSAQPRAVAAPLLLPASIVERAALKDVPAAAAAEPPTAPLATPHQLVLPPMAQPRQMLSQPPSPPPPTGP